MQYCHKHDRHFDSDYDLECPECEDDDNDLKEQAEERRQEQLETYFHPSEGFNPK